MRCHQILSSVFTLAMFLAVCLSEQGAHGADPKGIALMIGLNKVSPEHYAGWEGELVACENDARDISKIAKSRGFEVTSLLTSKATRSAVVDAMKSASDKLESGDIFLLSYSGHGGQVFDENNDEKSNGPDDVLDETWCLFDGQVIDDELYLGFRRFKAGVRILVLSDSCHSGTVTRVYFYNQLVRMDMVGSRNHEFVTDARSQLDLGKFFLSFDRDPDSGIGSREVPLGPPPFRMMPFEIAQRTWVLHRDEYKKIGTNAALSDPDIDTRGDDRDVVAFGLLISGCQDNQLSKDGWLNGAFTGALKQVWTSGVPAEIKNYRSFHSAIVKRFENDPSQTPNYYPFGTISAAFESQPPFTVK